MSLPVQVQSRLHHFRSQLQNLVAARLFSVVMVCRIFGISRTTFYQYRLLAEEGKQASFDCSPHRHGSAKPQAVIDTVLSARLQFPSFGKQRLANILFHQQIHIAPNTVQSILKKHSLTLPQAKRQPLHWNRFEAIAPNAIWAIDICYLYTSKQDGFDLYLISIIDDHSRKIVASGLYEHQTICEVAEVLKAAVLSYGVPLQLVCDNGSQFTCSEFRRVCAAIRLEIDYAPPHFPQYKGKIERFFLTTRREMPRSDDQERAKLLHEHWIEDYNQSRIHSRVTDEEGHAHQPQFRFTWKRSAALPMPAEINLNEVFSVQRPQTGSRTRQINANRRINFRKHSYHLPELNKGDVIEIKDCKDRIEFFYLGKLLQRIIKPSRQQTATTRKVKAGGIVKFKRKLIKLDLPKGIYVLIVREGQDYVFYLSGQVIFRITSQQKC
jgi:putative transposase